MKRNREIYGIDTNIFFWTTVKSSTKIKKEENKYNILIVSIDLYENKKMAIKSLDKWDKYTFMIATK